MHLPGLLWEFSRPVVVGPATVRFGDNVLGATVLVGLLVGRVGLLALAWRHSTKHTTDQSMPEKDLSVDPVNLSDQVQTHAGE